MRKSEFVERMIDRLTKVGWTQGTYQDGNGFCLVGALIDVDCSGVDRTGQLCEEIEHDLNTIIVKEFDGSDVIYYNDFMCESVDEALAPLEKLRATYEEMGV